MTTLTTPTIARVVNVAHPICRSEFAALVFCGDRSILGELPAECTASTPFKFAMVDPRLDASDDFARSPHMPLPLWPADQVVPTPAVCFVFAERAHPVAQKLAALGGLDGEHCVFADDVFTDETGNASMSALEALVATLAPSDCIAMFGFGDQGARIALLLQRQCGLAPDRFLLVDSGSDSSSRAATCGPTVVTADEALDGAAAAIYSPLMRYENLHRFVREAHRRAMAVFDNSMPSMDRQQFRGLGCVSLEPAADRAIETRGTVLRPRAHGLPIHAYMVRNDRRTIGGTTVRQLHGGHLAPLRKPSTSIDLAAQPVADPLAGSTFASFQHAWVSLRRSKAAPVFAAREFAASIWPASVDAVFPARCAEDLGSTRYERLLKRHIDEQEIIMAAQTSLQQVILGVVAHHYSSRSPIVEIGSALGGSVMLLATATDEHRPQPISIDPQTATRHIMRFGFEQIEQADRLRQIIFTSDDAANSLGHLRNQAGLLFIDGLHTEAAWEARLPGALQFLFSEWKETPPQPR